MYCISDGLKEFLRNLSFKIRMLLNIFCVDKTLILQNLNLLVGPSLLAFTILNT